MSIKTRRRFGEVFTRLAIFIGLASGLPLAASAQSGPTVQTVHGPVQGVAAGDGAKYLGVRYAAAPVGTRRFRPPEPPAPWTTAANATQFGSSCPQPASPFGLASSNEDCLFLNVYTPVRGPLAVLRRAPVMVWFHPGAFLYGEAARFDPTDLVEQGVVVVTVNYRLGALGFLAHTALTAESANASSGNYGIQDQQAALRWVRDNIVRFGGDANRVTIFGESAGGLSVHAHLISPGSAGLFDRAIVQSGAYSLTPPTRAVAETQGTAFATAVGCTDAACLRNAPVSALLAGPAPVGLGYLPNVDGAVLPTTFLDAFTRGAFQRVPIIEGSTHDEFRLFVALSFDLTGQPVTAEGYPAAIAAVLGLPPAVVPAIVAQYPLTNYASPALALAAVGTDAVFACNAQGARQLLSLHTPVWGYEFNDPNAPQGTLPPVSFPYGAYHGAELEYLFDVRPNLPRPPLTADQQTLSTTMVRYWTQFARIANPNGLQTPLWSRYFPLVLTNTQKLAPPTPQLYNGFNADHKCDFWTALASASSGS
jgi:para-nitrobenzyl esterase